MKVLVTGAGGQLGKEFIAYFTEKGDTLYSFTRKELDVTDATSLNPIMKNLKPDLVLHCAAYTKVDAAEENWKEAYAINALGTRNIAVASEVIGAKLVYFSTDYVFDGMQARDYHEFDQTNPLNVYGASKLAGEEAVKNFHSRYFIMRTSWLYGGEGPNFVRTMQTLAQTKKELRVVCDQIGCPTYTKDLVCKTGEMIQTNQYGTYHVSNRGECSWFEFATRIFQEMGAGVKVIPVKTEEYGVKAERPRYSVLQHLCLELNGFAPMRQWEEALREYIIEIS
ncbi:MULTISPECIES: dTDP-4-dehydrorhamnose reductase [Bacillus]|uniref:dTDP-4-dehydrorhamnose reductase n=1 Tax=Bacillus TaxID=1386 RepID=UPI00035E8FDA|nr:MULTISPECIES: dTDP-4-dehydrorhamnose reductase [Bacillus]MED4650733.1 dTDP-4-dehydrorhamnose reductase [Bacillus pseudomycoides]PEE06169.1 dTDP-4-dehydrorhamnose reductase [Bacillus pseudomycoides]PEF76670.1 dTDP-4-dehydrorhamnose reductase [Bacillus pseudomycoides]PEI45981.1 dTDP-4-dehydrorhamnose reductase [Bacillus pseudomycoides]PEJ39448.1 dTDP-4-dehydrorhamnose reductase [Bacillus pseudomycoides]